MYNTMNSDEIVGRKIFGFGPAGAGKTTQFLTLPGKKLAIMFDPAGANALRGFDVDVMAFLSTGAPRMRVLSRKKGSSGTAIKGLSCHESYDRFVDWFEEHTEVEDTFFAQYDAILFDSMTSLQAIILDWILHMENREGTIPDMADFGAMASMVNNIMRSLCSLEQTVLVTAHVEPKEEKATGKIFNTPLIVGKQAFLIPSFFSDCFFLTADANTKKFTAQTMSDKKTLNLKSSKRTIEPFIDVTIGDFKTPEKFGIGKLFQEG